MIPIFQHIITTATVAIVALFAVSCNRLSPESLNRRVLEADAAAAGQSPEIAHELYKGLVDDFLKTGDEGGASMCLYNMATNYLNQADTSGMWLVITQMEELSREHPDNIRVIYDLHSVKGAYYAHIHQGRGDEASLQEMLSENRKAIAAQEKMSVEEQMAARVNPVWNYYNAAVCYDLFFDPPQRDSISKYLDLARKANATFPGIDRTIRQSGYVSIKDEQAWLYYYDGNIAEAEREMNEVLALIDSVEAVTPNTILTEKSQAYDFFVELYRETGQPEKALEYEILKEQNELYRLGAERNKAVREVEARYDVAKAEARTSRMRSVALALAVIVLILLIVVIFNYFRRREKEQMRYTAAVEALVEGDPKVRELTKAVDRSLAKNIFQSSLKPLSAVERRYILLFMSGATTEGIASAMNVDTSSVYTMKYRIKKKFPKEFALPF